MFTHLKSVPRKAPFYGLLRVPAFVQVPSSAVKKKASGGNLRLFFFRTEASLEPKVQGLRFAPVGAKPRSTGPRAPHLPRYVFKKKP